MTTGTEVPESVQHMLDALELEIAHLRSRGGTTRLEVRGGKRTGESNGLWLYAFPAPRELPGRLKEDTPLRVQIEERETKGNLVSFGEEVLVVGLEKDLGESIPVATLNSDDAELLDALRGRMEDALAGKIEFFGSSAARILGEDGGAAGAAAGGELPAGVLTGLNEEQQDALARAMKASGLFVWGPPGTGKTTLIARMVEAFCLRGLSVLLVSNTNVAVDTALEKICERLSDTPEFQAGQVLRVGPIAKPELERDYGEYLDLERVIRRLTVPLQQRKAEANRQLADCKSEIERIDRGIAEWNQVEALSTETERHREQVEEAKVRLQGMEIQVSGGATRIHEMEAKLQVAEGMGGVRRFLTGTDPQRVRGSLGRLRSEQERLEAARDAGNNKLQEAEDLHALIRVRLAKLERAMAGNPDRNALAAERSAVEELVQELTETLKDLDKQVAEVRERVRKNCCIMGTTVYRSYLKGGVERTFDVVVIDEASMVMLPMAWFAAGLGRRAFVVAGDFRQLPAVVVSDDPVVQEWLKQSVFEKNRIPLAVGAAGGHENVAALQIQYRMDPPISDLISELYYPDHKLEVGPSVLIREAHDWPELEQGLAYVDTSPLRPWVARPAGSYSRYNLLHATLMRNLVVAARERLSPDGGRTLKELLGLVTPFAAQAQLTEKLLVERFGERNAPVAATVHRFQGNEKDFMLLDIPDSVGLPPSGFIRAVSPDEDGSRLFNVGLSRARRGLVVVANFSWLRRNLDPGTGVRQILDRMEERGRKLEIEDILPAGEQDWIASPETALPAGIPLPEGTAGAFDEGSFYPAFLEDLRAASESITLVSPFLTATGTSRWVDVLRSARQRGVQVRVVLRPYEEGADYDGQYREIVAGLEELGVGVELLERIHQKIACIDGRVLWHGSLNILSHRNTAESMLRLPSKAAAEAVLKFLAPRGRQSRDRDRSSSGVPACIQCGSVSVQKTGRYGPYYQCSNPECAATFDDRKLGCRDKGGTAPSGKRKHGYGSPSEPCPVKGCKGHLVSREGRHGPFLGCSEYPRCREWLWIRDS